MKLLRPPQVKKDLMVKRHLAKTISYRILGTFTTIAVALGAGLDWQISSLLGIGELLFKPVVYFLHERFWYKFIRFGLHQ